MATKKATKKTTTKKKAPVKKRTVAAKKTAAKKSATKTVQTQTESNLRLLAFSAIAAVLTYAFASWAIDSGSLWYYLATLISTYLTVHYLVQFTHKQFLNK